MNTVILAASAAIFAVVSAAIGIFSSVREKRRHAVAKRVLRLGDREVSIYGPITHGKVLEAIQEGQHN